MDAPRPTPAAPPPPPHGPLISSPPATPAFGGVGNPASPPPGINKIQHTKPGIGSPLPAGPPARPMSRMGEEARPLPVAESTGPSPAGGGKITAFGKARRHEDLWSRTPNTTGVGAIHVKTFHCKLNDEALVYLDQTINEWLDAHPQYEVKFVSSSIGTFTGKLKEPALICQVWV